MTVPVYSPYHPAIQAQEAWLDAHDLWDAADFFIEFRERVNSGDFDPMLSLFTDVITDRKNELRKHR